MKTKLKILSVATVLVLLATVALAQFDSQNVSLIGRWPYGYCYGTFADSNYAYFANGAAMQIIDVSTPSSPVMVGEIITSATVGKIQVAGNYAYVVNWDGGLRIIDISDPTQPTEVGSYVTGATAWGLFVINNTVYLGNDTLGIRIIDVSDPTSPNEIGSIPTLGRGSFAHVVDSIAYVVSSDTSIFQIFNVSDPADPEEIGSYDFGGEAFHVSVSNNYAYLPDRTAGLRIIDVSNPDSLMEVGFIDVGGSASKVHLLNNYAFVAALYGGLRIVDVSNPTSPTEVGSYDTDGRAEGIHISNHYAYVADHYGGLKIIDVGNLTAPIEVASFGGGYTQGIHFANDHVYTADNGLRIFDISDPDSPTQTAHLDDIGQTRHVFVSDNIAYAAINESNGFMTINVSNPESPQILDSIPPGWALWITIVDNYAYVAAGWGGLHIIDVSNPASLSEVGMYDTDNAASVFVSNDYAYVADGSSGLRIIDVSDPSSPTEVGSFNTNGWTQDVYVFNGYAFVAASEHGLRILDVSRPESPSEVSSIPTKGTTRRVFVSGNDAYVGDGFGLRIFDVSNPISPMEVGSFNTGGLTCGIHVADNLIYLADGGDGFYILQNEAPTRCFTLTEADLIPVCGGSVDWGDYDSDGDLDVIQTGADPSEAPFSIVYRNDGNNTFNIGANLIPVLNGSVEWGDYNNDGRLDILLTGMSGGSYYSAIYRQTDENLFRNINANLLDAGYSSAAWGDYDNDGDLDILLTGFDGSDSYSLIYSNDGSDVFTNIEANLIPICTGEADWGDYDNDGDLDILLTGKDASNAYTIIYRNDNNGIFVDIQANLQPMCYTTASWVDYDNDGDLDIFLTGRGFLEDDRYTKIYRNDGNDTFTDIYVDLPPTSMGSGCWGDYDNDGDLDLLLMGWNYTRRDQTKLYRNDGDGVFTDIVNDLVDIVASTAQWGDHDNDGDLDLIMTGYDRNYVLYSNIYRNDGTVFNTVPNAPTNLSSSFENGTLTVSWSPASDNETPSPGLSYNLCIGTTPNGDEIMSSHSDNSTGYRRISGMGNVQKDTSWRIYNLDPRGTYYWSVQSVDAAYAGSEWASLIVSAIDNHEAEIPAHFSLSQNYPNPFNPTTTIRYELPKDSKVIITIYDVLGKEIQTLVNEHQKSGRYTVNFDAKDLASGVYFYELQVGSDFVETKKMLLLR